jgi:hypothetical protein
MLYRVRRHETPGSDEMIREMVIQGPRGEYRDPGPWIVDELRRRDIFQGGTVDPTIARRNYVDNVLLRQPATVAAEKRLDHMTSEMAQDISKYAWFNKRHFSQGLRQ